jgi:hypothetical protein
MYGVFADVIVLPAVLHVGDHPPLSWLSGFGYGE